MNPVQGAWFSPWLGSWIPQAATKSSPQLKILPAPTKTQYSQINTYKNRYLEKIDIKREKGERDEIGGPRETPGRRSCEDKGQGRLGPPGAGKSREEPPLEPPNNPAGTSVSAVWPPELAAASGYPARSLREPLERLWGREGKLRLGRAGK